MPKKQTVGKDTIQVILSDTHSGSNHALFLGRDWSGLNGNNHTPTSDQIKIRECLIKYAKEIKDARHGKAVKVIVNGDAIDGNHHIGGDVCTTNPKEHADIHIEIMSEFQKLIGWQAGDQIYYVKGTEIHTGDWEDYIGKEMNAVMDGDYYAFNFLDLKTNGRLSRFLHHGAAGGDGANEGNALRNWLRSLYFDAIKDNDKVPDIVYTAHVHNPTYACYEWRDGMKFSVIHGIITPSWQMKTRYAWMKAPKSKNKIGGVWQEIKSDGSICVPHFSVMGYQ